MSGCPLFHEQVLAEPGAPDVRTHLEGCAQCRALAQRLAAVSGGLAEVVSAPVPLPPFSRLAPQAHRAARARRWRGAARRTAPFVITGALAAAAALALTLGLLGRSEVERVRAGESYAAEQRPRTLSFASGAVARLEHGRVQIARDGEQVRLAAGALSASVPPLGARSFAVLTPHATVTVHGTRFRVAADPSGTTVEVEEGRVEVRPAGPGRAPTLLGPQERLRVEPLATFQAQLRAEAVAALDQGALAVAEGALERLLATEPEPLLAAETHAMLAWAAAGRGDRVRALVEYRAVARLLPAGAAPVWAENAAAELALLLEQTDPDAAREAWLDSLRRFPGGLHREQARERSGKRP